MPPTEPVPGCTSKRSPFALQMLVLQVVRQIVTATTQRTESEPEARQTRDTQQDTVKVQRCRLWKMEGRGVLRHGEELRPHGGGGEGKRGKTRVDT